MTATVTQLRPEAEGATARNREARQWWEDRYGRMARTIRNWQITAACFFLLALGLVGLLMVLLAKHETQVVVIKEDDLGDLAVWGEAEQFATLESRHYQAALRRFILNTRSVFSDRNAQDEAISSAYALSTIHVGKQLQAFFEAPETAPFERGKSERVLVKVHSVTQIGDSLSTWLVRWNETTTNRIGQIVANEDWTATVETKRLAAEVTLDQMLRNPASIYVSALSWTRDLSSPDSTN